MRKPKTPPPPPPSAKFVTVPLDKIDVGKRQRSFDPKWAEAIAATLPDMGLKQPIEVSASGDRFRLIAGLHRLEAAKLAGWIDIPARLVLLDGKNEDASAAIHEAMENLMRGELSAFDRMAHLGAMKEAHDALFPHASDTGKLKKFTRASEANQPIFGRFAFSRSVAEHIDMSRSLVKLLNKAWADLSPESRRRLPGTRLARKQTELVALSELQPTAQSRALDYLLSEPPAAQTVAEAWAEIINEPLPSAADRRVERYQRTMQELPEEECDAILKGIEDKVKDFARRRGWLQ